MKEERISTGYTVFIQGVIISFCVLLVLVIALIINKDLDETAWIFLCCIFIFILIIVKRLMSFADLYLSSDYIIYRRIIGEKKRLISEIKAVNEGFLPFNYYIEFNDGKRIYFQLKPKDMLRRLGDSNKTVLNNFKKKLDLDEK